jgi:hypothetical protein
MVLKVIIISVLFVISGILGRPQQQSDKPLCSDYDGYRCVSSLKCANSEPVGGEAAILSEIFSDGAGLLGVRNSDRPEDAECSNIDLRTTEQICCKESNIIPDVPSSVKICSSFSSKGYKCVPKAHCDLVTQRGLASVIEGAVCNINTDIRQSQSAPDERICCHEDSIKVADTFCTEFASESYKCVTKSKCHSEPHRREAALTSICSRTGHHQAAIEVSKENDRVCCHQDDIEEVILKEELCSDYTSEGYKCIDQSKCVAIDPRQAGITKPERPSGRIY